MEIVIVTSAKNNPDLALLEAMGMPFTKEVAEAKRG